jgi:hypothetical protein
LTKPQGDAAGSALWQGGISAGMGQTFAILALISRGTLDKVCQPAH